MKKFLKIGGALFLLLLVAAIVLPMIFKKEIKQAVQTEINKNINAEVYFGDFSVTLFRNFPNITVGLDNFGVVGIDQFKGDTLADIQSFRLVLDIMSVIKGEEYKLRKILLDHPNIKVKVLKNGKANYDIAKADTSLAADTAAVDTTPSTPIKIQLSEYALRNANIVYNDLSSDIYAEIKNLTHTGSGDFETDLFDFETQTHADEVTVKMEGTRYLNKALIDIDLNVAVDQKNSIYTLNKNKFGLNNLELNLNGWVSQKGDDIGMDLKFGTNQNRFKSILSMVPGMYTEDFKDIETDGTFTLSGWAKGTYNAKSLPGFGIDLGVANGYFHYPDLPSAVSNINFELKAETPDGDLNKLKVNFPKFHAELGNNPIDAKLVASGLMSDNINVDADLKAKVNLEEMATMFPMEGQELKGQLDVTATAKGIYNEKNSTFPTVNADIALADGYVKSADFPSALEKMSMKATMSNPDGQMSSTYINVSQFHTELDGEPIDMTLEARNLDDVDFKLSLKGSLDLEKLNKIYPLEGTEMAGKIVADIQTAGKQSDIEAERYTQIPTSGSMTISNLSYKDADIPQGVKITQGKVTFTPQKLNIEQFKGFLGHSNVDIKGSLDNYLAYALVEGEEIRGNMTLVSTLFDVNEWMSADESEGEAAAPAEGQDEEMSVFEVPKGIDFVFNATLSKVLYDNLVLKNLVGQIIMRNQEVRFEQVGFQTLGGQFKLGGSYNTADITKPAYNLDMNLVGLDVQETFTAFNTVQKLAPVAKFVNGKFNSAFKLNGILGQDMMPDMATITGDGNAMMLNSKVSNLKILDEIASKTKLNNFKEMDISDTKFWFKIENGKLKVEPFDVKAGSTKMNIGGSNALDGAIDYLVKLDVPAGAAGAQAIGALSSLTGKSLGGGENVKIDLGLGGTFDKPKITSVGGELTDGVKGAVEDKVDEVKDQVQDKIDETKEDLQKKLDDEKKRLQDEVDAKKKEAEAKLNAEKERLRKEAEAKKKAEEERLRLEAEKKKKEAEDKAKKELEKLKDKNKLPWKK
ncbi:MAG: hypothetical protein H6581_04010 [Bacteroidia bacterium]|nr:hypothetical protein [Bacteroidia bacterium]